MSNLFAPHVAAHLAECVTGCGGVLRRKSPVEIWPGGTTFVAPRSWPVCGDLKGGVVACSYQADFQLERHHRTWAP